MNIETYLYTENIKCHDIELILDNIDALIDQFPVERQNVILKDPNYLDCLKGLKIRCDGRDFIKTSYIRRLFKRASICKKCISTRSPQGI